MHKIHGEHTRPTNEPALCLTCNHVTIVRGTRFGDDRVLCHVLGRVTFHVTECGSYSDNRLIPVYRLEETAWRWMPDLNRMVSPGELLRLNQAASAPPPTNAVDPQAQPHPDQVRAKQSEANDGGGS